MKLTGNIPTIQRLITDMWSFDHAFANPQFNEIGLPVGIEIEIFGPTGCGKTTATYGLAGMVANKFESNIVVADFEEFDERMMKLLLEQTGFDGEVKYIDEETDEDMIDKLLHWMGNKKSNFGVGIIDGIGAISPISEAKGETGEANMGRRAFALNQFSRKSRRIRRDNNNEKTFIVINHAVPVLGARGTTTPGGTGTKFLAKVRISLKRARIKNKEEKFPDGSYVLEGTVVKNNFGIEDTKFYLFMLAGKGIHQGLTWMYDGWINKVVSREGFIGNIKVGDKHIGKMREIVMKAHEGDNEFFNPFRDALNNIEPSRDEISTDEGQSESDEDADSSSDGDE